MAYYACVQCGRGFVQDVTIKAIVEAPLSYPGGIMEGYCLCPLCTEGLLGCYPYTEPEGDFDDGLFDEWACENEDLAWHMYCLAEDLKF